jgi:adenylate kinase family enzyme
MPVAVSIAVPIAGEAMEHPAPGRANGPRQATDLNGVAHVQRILVMGPPGSGKSTMARHLGARFGLPVFHLDKAYWRPGWIEAPSDEFRAEVERIASLPAWVIDGNFTDSIEPRFRAADALVYLDMPSWLSLVRVVRRTVTGYGRTRRDLPEDCPEKFDLHFLRFVWTYNRTRRARNLALVASFERPTTVLRGRHAASGFVNEMVRTLGELDNMAVVDQEQHQMPAAAWTGNRTSIKRKC